MTEQLKRPNPDELSEKQTRSQLGVLKIFFGMSAGFGKTHAMLEEAQEKPKEDIDVVIGIVMTHGQHEIKQLLSGIPIIPEKVFTHRGIVFNEMDLEKNSSEQIKGKKTWIPL